MNVTISNLRIMISIYWNPPQFEVASDFDIQQKNGPEQRKRCSFGHQIMPFLSWRLILQVGMMHPKDSNSLVLYRFYQQPKQ